MLDPRSCDKNGMGWGAIVRRGGEVEPGVDVAVARDVARTSGQELAAHPEVDAEPGFDVREADDEPLAVPVDTGDPSTHEAGQGSDGLGPGGARVRHRDVGQDPSGGDEVELTGGDRDLGGLGHQSCRSSSGSIRSPAAARALARPTARPYTAVKNASLT